MPETVANTEGTQGGQAGTQGASNTGAGSQAQTGAAQTAGTQGTQGAGTATGDTRTGAQTQSGYTYTEDRSKWIPPHRLTEESAKRTKLEADFQTARQQIAALTNTTPPDAKTAKAEEIKAAFFELMPSMKRFAELNEEQIERLFSTPDQIEQANEFVNAQWSRHGKQVLTDLAAKVSEHIGGKLTERAEGRLKSAFASMIQSEAAKSKRDGATTAPMKRYLDGDSSLVEEFAKEWAEDYFEPARRKVTAQEVNRGRGVPNSTGRTQVTTVQRPTEFKSLDDRLDYAANLYKERGGKFERE